jgi:hypothetical protein
VLEGGHQSDPSLEDALGGWAQPTPASLAEKAAGDSVTGLTEHRWRPYGPRQTENLRREIPPPRGFARL